MIHPPTLHPDDELLVDYLDRRLNRSEQRDVEQRLASDPTFRDRLEGLQQSWDALDEIPVRTWDAAFAATTLSMAAVTAEEERSTQTPSHSSRWAPWVPRALLIAIALVVGFACIAVPRRAQYNAVLRDLPVSYRMDAYRAVGDLSFLRALDQEGVFSDDLLVDDDSDSTDAVIDSERDLAELPLAVAGSTDAIEKALRRMPIDSIPELQSRSRRFAALSRTEQASLREFHDTLMRQEDAVHLVELLARYHDWIAMLPSSDRAELMQLPPTERMEKIRRLVAEQLRRHPDWIAVTPGDVKHLHTWTADYVTRHAPELLQRLPNRQQEMLNRVKPDHRTWFLVRAIAGAPSRVKDDLPELTDAEKIRYLEGFSPELTRKMATELQTHGTRAIFDVFPSMSVQRRGNARRLEQVFEDLPPTEKEALLRMGPDELPRELNERYRHRQRGPGAGRRPPGPPDDRGRRERRPDPPRPEGTEARW